MLQRQRARYAMTIEISKPELEALILERLASGAFQSVEDVLLQALKPSLPTEPLREISRKPKKNFAQFLVESPLPGSGLKLERRKDYPRPLDL
jgi:hypothetical protein